jgi:hypothetical protein
MILPDVNAVTVLIDTTCMTGPDPAYPVSTNVTRGDILRVLGMSPDEQWWNVRKPSLAEGSCWLPQPLTHFHGDFSTLALVEPPNLQDVLNPDSLRVEIQAITLDSQGRYVVDYTTQGFAEQLPGTHIHFFFDNVPPEEVGINGAGNRLMFGGPSPFMGYLQSNKPDGVTKMCALVANPDHSVILDSGNCFPLP